MKKKILMSVIVLLAVVVTCNVYMVLIRNPFSTWFVSMESLAGAECAAGEISDEILGKDTENCHEHNSEHEWMACTWHIGKCCSPSLETSKPSCLDPK